tara:strand:- start:9 stop:200 length:192 start_codon:yes stop_codon:yes gene_type:complete
MRRLIMARLKEYKVETQTILTRTYYLDAKDHDHAEDLFYECINELASEDDFSEEEVVDIREIW